MPIVFLLLFSTLAWAGDDVRSADGRLLGQTIDNPGSLLGPYVGTAEQTMVKCSIQEAPTRMTCWSAGGTRVQTGALLQVSPGLYSWVAGDGCDLILGTVDKFGARFDRVVNECRDWGTESKFTTLTLSRAVRTPSTLTYDTMANDWRMK